MRSELTHVGGDVATLDLDVSDQSSVCASAHALGHRPVDVLINNAGAWFTDRRASPTGLELTFATNVLGPHLRRAQREKRRGIDRVIRCPT